MFKKVQVFLVLIFLRFFLFSCSPGQQDKEKVVPTANKYEDLVSLYKEFRDFLKPKIKNGVPNYTASAMEKQYRGLKNLQQRLVAVPSVDQAPCPFDRMRSVVPSPRFTKIQTTETT